MARTNIILIILMVLSFSCKKDNSNIVNISGIIINPLESAPIEGVKVKIEVKSIKNGIANSSFEEIGEGLTNSSGEYSFEIKKEYASSYRISTSKTNYFTLSEEIPVDDISTIEEYQKNINIYPIAYYYLRIKNTNYYDWNDEISLTISSNQVIENTENCNNTTFYKKSKLTDDIIECKAIGNSTLRLDYIVTKEGYTNSYQTEIFCNSFDTTKYELFY